MNLEALVSVKVEQKGVFVSLRNNLEAKGGKCEGWLSVGEVEGSSVEDKH